MLYKRGRVYWMKLAGKRRSLQTTDEATARRMYATARLDLELADDAFFRRALVQVEGQRRRKYARERGEIDRQSVGGAIDRWLRAMAVELKPSTLEK